MPNQTSPIIVEIMGVAGAGKTTITQMLMSRNPAYALWKAPSPDKSENYSFFVKNTLKLLPQILQFKKMGDRCMTKREFAWFLVVNGWHETLSDHANIKNPIVIMDQGPIFLITQLLCFGPTCLRSPAIQAYWQKAFSELSQSVNLIINLDASNSCLYDRILTRAKEHIIKNETPDIAEIFLDQWRAGYAQIIHHLLSFPQTPKVVHLNSELNSPDELAARIEKEISEVNHTNG